MLISKCGPITPRQHAVGVWAVPFSLATTWGITFVFFSSWYLDVSVPRVDFLSDDSASRYRVVPFGDLGI